MGVYYESQVHATCDNCGDYEMTSTMRMVDFKKYLRKKGWRIGTICLCPQCVKGNEIAVKSIYNEIKLPELPR